MEPFSTSVFKVLMRIFATTAKICASCFTQAYAKSCVTNPMPSYSSMQHNCSAYWYVLRATPVAICSIKRSVTGQRGSSAKRRRFGLQGPGAPASAAAELAGAVDEEAGVDDEAAPAGASG